MCVLHPRTFSVPGEFLADTHHWKAHSVGRRVTAVTGGNAMRGGAIAECISARTVRTRAPNLAVLSHLDIGISKYHSLFTVTLFPHSLLIKVNDGLPQA